MRTGNHSANFAPPYCAGALFHFAEIWRNRSGPGGGCEEDALCLERRHFFSAFVGVDVSETLKTAK